jgi:hypothetical protein
VTRDLTSPDYRLVAAKLIVPADINAGLMYDQYHPNATMYAQMGNYLAEILKAV